MIVDRDDGYEFSVPVEYISLIAPANPPLGDAYFRDPAVLDLIGFVAISSPSSSRFRSVEDLGSPEEAARRRLDQYNVEFMTTRLGVRRTENILSAERRTGVDGRVYYVFEYNIKSIADTNEMAVSPSLRVPTIEWDRRYIEVATVANKRLYEMRIQCPERAYAAQAPRIQQIADSFGVRDVEIDDNE